MLLLSNANTVEENFSPRFEPPGDLSSGKISEHGAYGLIFEQPSHLGESPTANFDTWWALRKIRVLQAWQYSQSKGKDQKIALISATCGHHVELEGDSVVSRAANVAGQETQLRLGTCLASMAVSRQTGEIAGAAPAARIFNNHDTSSNTSQELAKAVAQGVGTILLTCAKLPKKEVLSAKKKGLIVIAPAGDDALTIKESGAILVAGSTGDDKVWDGSNFGEAVSFAAPAERVWGADTEDENGIAMVSGTAGAAALTAGVAALWRAHFGEPKLMSFAKDNQTSVQDLFEKAVRKTARCPNHWNENDYGAGIIDAEALLRLPLEQI